MITFLPSSVMLERSFLAMPLITAVSPVTKLPLPSVYVIVTLPLASTSYSPLVICFSSSKVEIVLVVLPPSLV